MSFRKLGPQASLLRIYIGDFDKVEHQELFRVIIEKARAAELAGCTVYRGFWGYGVRGQVHTDLVLEGAGERPLRIDIVDTQERVRNFASLVIPLLKKAGGLVTEKEIHVHQYQGAPVGGDVKESTSSKESQMMKRDLSGENVLLRIYIDEQDKADHKPLFQAILEKSKKLGNAGCTVFQGIMGYGASSIVHKGHLLRVSQDLPMVLEIVDRQDKIHQLLQEIRPILNGALVTEEKVIVHHYEAGEKIA